MPGRLRKLLLILILVLLVLALPTWPYSADWGYFPSGGLALIFLLFLLLILLNSRHRLVR